MSDEMIICLMILAVVIVACFLVSRPPKPAPKSILNTVDINSHIHEEIKPPIQEIKPALEEIAPEPPIVVPRENNAFMDHSDYRDWLLEWHKTQNLTTQDERNNLTNMELSQIVVDWMRE